MDASSWEISVDTGGTFTDAIACDPRGDIHRIKILSSSRIRAVVENTTAHPDGTLGLRLSHLERWPAEALLGLEIRYADQPIGSITAADPANGRVAIDPVPRREYPPLSGTVEIVSPEPAPVLAIRALTSTPIGRPFPRIQLRLATTRGTNALLTRSGSPTALWITRGFADLLEIGTQQRPDLFALDIERPAPLPILTAEVPHRIDAAGKSLQPLDLESMREDLEDLRSNQIESLAIALLHSDRHSEAERDLASWARKGAVPTVVCSSDVSIGIGFLTRTETAVCEAYLTPVLRGFLDDVQNRLGHDAVVHVMTSSGGLVRADAFRATAGLLSGPAGGVVGSRHSGLNAGRSRLLTFDMGGTSTDVSRVDPDIHLRSEHRVGDVLLRQPSIDIETVAAGGGSICRFDGADLVVGPESAGASPGPAAYGAGGPLTVTDCNLLLGRVSPEDLPIPIDPAASRRAANEVLDRLGKIPSHPLPDIETLAEGFLELAVEKMAGAIRQVSSRIGEDPASYCLVPFGGAGGQHACSIAKRLGISTIVLPEDPGILSAVGLAASRIERIAEAQLLAPFEDVLAGLPDRFFTIEAQAFESMLSEGGPRGEFETRSRTVEVRLAGQESSLEIPAFPLDTVESRFRERYSGIFGHYPEGRSLELVGIRVIVSLVGAKSGSTSAASEPAPSTAPSRASATRTAATRQVFHTGTWIEADVLARSALLDGEFVHGPAIIVEPQSSLWIEPGWTLSLDRSGALMVEEAKAAGTVHVPPSRPEDPVHRSLVGHRLESIALEMGEQLRRTAISTNIRDRLDFSCAILDETGRLVVNAPHIPVHLGSLGVCVRRTAEAVSMGPGDVILTNHPAYGGSHLPDLTVIAPIHDSSGSRIAFVASRAHHAEIGGSVPGSMPVDATSLEEEGVLFPPSYLFRVGQSCEEEIGEHLRTARFPSRAVSDNLADLRAMVAALRGGAEQLRQLSNELGHPRLTAFFHAILENASACLRRSISKLPNGRRIGKDTLDDGTALQVAVDISETNLTIDFSGSSKVHPGNANATEAIVRSATVYVLRLLVPDRLPLNEGLLEATRLEIPRGLLRPDFEGMVLPAIFGGNVETSQRIVDILLEALGLSADGPGSMSNLVVGNSRFSFYETIGGGAGATPTADGASGVHVHMTNTRITDPELVEHRFPIRIDRFAIRRGTGGIGRHRGGDGLVRELTFLEDCSLSFLGERRSAPPRGREGGGDGSAGTQLLIRSTGTQETLSGRVQVTVAPGDRLLLETPSGGGWGSPTPGS